MRKVLCSLLVFVLSIAVIAALAIPVQATNSCNFPNFELTQVYYHKNWNTGNYVWDAAGPITSGAQLGDYIVWNETGNVDASQNNSAIAVGSVTLSNGNVIPFQFGTTTHPYLWWPTSTTVVNGSELVNFYVEGPMYVNGNYCTYYQADGQGTLVYSTFTTIAQQ